MTSFLRHNFLFNVVVLTLTTTMTPSVLPVVAQTNVPCSMCQDAGAILANPDRIVPFVGIGDEDNPTCRQVAEFAESDEVPDANVCGLIQAQATFCGCPESPTTPLNECSLCPNGDAPGFPDLFTPYGDTCGELAEYLTYTSTEQCDTERIEIIQRTGWLCNCPDAQPGCSLCPDGSRDIASPDRVVPFFNLGLNTNPTCGDLQRLSSLEFSDEFECGIIQQQAGFCGCPNVDPINACTFCPTGVAAPNADREAPTGDSCSELDEYFDFMDTAICQSPVTDAIRALGYFCGCPETESQCDLCGEFGSTLVSRERLADNVGTTCGELFDVVSTFTEESCLASAADRQVAGYRCCDDVAKPVCELRQNPQLCTQELLDSADQECECYNFCDGEFLGCEIFPGRLIPPDECDGPVITGCNEALLESDSGIVARLGRSTRFVSIIGSIVLALML